MQTCNASRCCPRKAIEISDEALETRLRALARELGFSVKKAVVELRGVCAGCAREAN